MKKLALSGEILGRLRVYCEMVQRGKPAAMLPIQARYANKAKTIIQSYGLNGYLENLAEGWLTLWIYKFPHILEVIKSVPQAPRTAYDHWVLGKLFGYSEAAIHEFIWRDEKIFDYIWDKAEEHR
ncbi:MAG: hypothetical protein ACM3YE_02530 [Bacteroidota bacterium]